MSQQGSAQEDGNVYEEARLQHIAQNNERLRLLGLCDASSAFQPARVTRPRKTAVAKTGVPPRRSTRDRSVRVQTKPSPLMLRSAVGPQLETTRACYSLRVPCLHLFLQRGGQFTSRCAAPAQSAEASPAQCACYVSCMVFTSATSPVAECAACPALPCKNASPRSNALTKWNPSSW